MVEGTAGGSTDTGASVRGGVGVELAVVWLIIAVVVNKPLVSIPVGTGRLTLFTVGTHCGTSLKTLVVVDAVTGTVTTEMASHLGVLDEHVVVDSSSAVNDRFLCGIVSAAEDFNRWNTNQVRTKLTKLED